jgi:hypothetical protein
MGLLSEDRTLADVRNESSIQKDDFLASSNALPGNIRKRQSREPDGPVWAMPSFPAKPRLLAANTQQLGELTTHIASATLRAMQ